MANAVGYSVDRLFDEKNTLPPIEELYPNLFDSEERQEEKQRQKEELSILRFKQFAMNLNKKIEKEVANNE